MSENNNVIQFPIEKIQQKTDYDEKILSSNILDIKVNHINEALMIILPSLFNNIDIAGFPPSEAIEDNDGGQRSGRNNPFIGGLSVSQAEQ